MLGPELESLAVVRLCFHILSVFPAESSTQPELRTTNPAQLHGLLFSSPCFYTTVKTSEVTYPA